MPDDIGSRRLGVSSRRRRQPGFPFWVIRGMRGPNSRPATVSAATWPPRDGELPAGGMSPSAQQRRPPAARAGRAGVDLRAHAPVAPRAAPSAPRRTRRLTAPWKRRSQSSPLPPPPGASADQQGKRRSRRTVYALIGLIVVQALFLTAIAWGLTSPTFRVRYVQVQGTSDPTLLAAIQRLPLSGCNIFRCDLRSRVRKVEALPAVASADVQVIYPNGLLVVVTPRRPALLWQTSTGSAVVASDGTVLGSRDSDPTYAHLALLPISDPSGAVFSGRMPQPGARIPAAEAEMAGQLRMGLTRTLGDSWTLQWSASTGFVASDGSTQVVFGTPNDAAQALTSYPDPATLAATPSTSAVDQGVAVQLQVLAALRAQLARNGQQAVLIDLRWGPHPFYRLVNGA